MSALEKTLQVNPTPLLMFSALKDFSGENISFLIHVRQWKANWASGSSKAGFLRKPETSKPHDEALIAQQFKQAVGIYASFVSLRYSDFPINISSTHLRDLEAIFEQYASLVCAEPAANAATPFENYWSSAGSEDLESQAGKDRFSVVTTTVAEVGVQDGLNKNQIDTERTGKLPELHMTKFGERLPTNIGIPDTFGPDVFDKAELSIKELVLTNTWAKFVKAGFAQNTVKGGFAAQLKSTVDAWVRGLPSTTTIRFRR